MKKSNRVKVSRRKRKHETRSSFKIPRIGSSLVVFSAATIGAVLVVSSFALGAPLIEESNFNKKTPLVINLLNATVDDEKPSSTSYSINNFDLPAVALAPQKLLNIRSPRINIGQNYVACLRGIVAREQTTVSMLVETLDNVALQKAEYVLDATSDSDQLGCVAFTFLEGTGERLNFEISNTGTREAKLHAITIYKLQNL